MAVALASETDFLVLHGDALMDLAEVLLTAGREAESVPVVQEALQLYEQKGNVVMTDATRSLLDELKGV